MGDSAPGDLIEDLVHQVAGDRPTAGLEARRGALVEYEDPGPEVFVTPVDQHVQLLGQRTHHRQGEDADDDAEDRERRPQRTAPDVADRFAHGPDAC